MVATYSSSSVLSTCLPLTYIWSVTEWDSGGNIFQSININGLDNTNNPRSITIADLKGTVALGTYELKLMVIDSVTGISNYSSGDNIKKITVNVVNGCPEVASLAIGESINDISVAFTGANKAVKLNSGSALSVTAYDS